MGNREKGKSATNTVARRRKKPITEAEELEDVMRGGLTPKDLSDDQRVVYNTIHDWVAGTVDSSSDVLSLGGYAGVGKTSLVSVLASEWDKLSLRVAFCTLTGKASGVLRKKLRSVGVDADSTQSGHFCGTIHSLFYQPVTDHRTGAILEWIRKGSLQEYDLLVIDEASMVDDEMLAEIRSYNIPILAVGDHGQLPPIGRSGSLMLSPDLRLEKIHRQAEGNPIIALSAAVRELGDLPKGYTDSPEVSFIKPSQFQEKLAEAYKAYNGPSDVGILAYTNRMRLQLNQLGHSTWLNTNPLGCPVHNTQVICLKNTQGLVFNGMRGMVDGDLKERDFWYEGKFFFPDDEIEIEGGALKGQFNQEKTFADFETMDRVCDSGGNFTNQRRWGAVGLLMDYGYALTVHKSQGSEFKHVFLVYERPSKASADDFRRWLYTAVSRASQKITIVEG